MVPNGCWSPSCCIPYSTKGKGYFLVPHLLSLTSCWSGLWHSDVGELEGRESDLCPKVLWQEMDVLRIRDICYSERF